MCKNKIPPINDTLCSWSPWGKNSFYTASVVALFQQCCGTRDDHSIRLLEKIPWPTPSGPFQWGCTARSLRFTGRDPSPKEMLKAVTWLYGGSRRPNVFRGRERERGSAQRRDAGLKRIATVRAFPAAVSPEHRRKLETPTNAAETCQNGAGGHWVETNPPCPPGGLKCRPGPRR